jgi:hypothetical protein
MPEAATCKLALTVTCLAACACCSNKDLANKDHLEDVKRNVMVVGELIDILSGEQKYLHRKLDRHIQTVVSGTGSRHAGRLVHNSSC